MTKLYGGIDLHANNSVIVLVDEQEQVVYETRTPNDLSKILSHLCPYDRLLYYWIRVMVLIGMLWI